MRQQSGFERGPAIGFVEIRTIASCWTDSSDSSKGRALLAGCQLGDRDRPDLVASGYKRTGADDSEGQRASFPAARKSMRRFTRKRRTEAIADQIAKMAN